MSSYDSVSDEGSMSESDYSTDDGGNPFIEPEAALKSSNPFISEKPSTNAPAPSKPSTDTKVAFLSAVLRVCFFFPHNKSSYFSIYISVQTTTQTSNIFMREINKYSRQFF